MFGFLKRQAPATELELFCAGLTKESLVKALQKNPGIEGLPTMFGLLLLYLAGQFWSGLKAEKRLKKFVCVTNADVIIFEALIYVYSAIAYELQNGEFEECEAAEGLFRKGLAGACGVIEGKAMFQDSYRFLSARSYVPALKDATEKFATVTEFSVGKKEPALRPVLVSLSDSDPITHIAIKIATAAFAQTQLQAGIEIAKRLMREEMQDRRMG